MKLEYFGHSCLGIGTKEGLKLLMDPYEPFGFGGRLAYSAVPGTWDLILISHEHADHGHVSESMGSPTVARSSGSFRGLEVTMWNARHGTAQGAVEATTRIYRFELEGVSIAHFGDLGEIPDRETLDALRGTDVLLVPVGGHFTLDAGLAWSLVKELSPRVVIPVHFKTASADLPIAPAEGFIEGASRLVRFHSGELELTRDSLPKDLEVWFLSPKLAAKGI